MKQVKESVIQKLLAQTQAEIVRAKSQRPGEKASSCGLLWDKEAKKWVMVLRLPSGQSCSCEVTETEGLLGWLLSLPGTIKDSYDLAAIADYIRAFAVRFGDPEMKAIVEKSFGLKMQGREL